MKKTPTKIAQQDNPEQTRDLTDGSPLDPNLVYVPLLLLYLIILTEGFVTISLEILTLRQMIPFVGNSVTVTSLIIGVFLLFLAYGYRKGGRNTAQPLKVLTRNFLITALLMGIGLSYAFIDIFFMTFKYLFSSNLLYALLSYLMLITAPIVYLLGQTVPITMHLHTKTDSVAKIGGNVLHASTIGSFLGSVLTSVLLMQFLGVAQTIFINFCLLTILVLILNLINQLRFFSLFILMAFSIIIFKLNVQFEHLAFLKTNTFGNYAVEKEDKYYQTQGKVLVINRSASSYVNDRNQSFPYIELIKKFLFKDLKLNNKEILVLGAGGFTLSAENTHGNHFTYVDIDPQLPQIVKDNFIKNIQGQIVIQDARQFLKLETKQFDVIFSDTYSHHLSIPTHLATKEYFKVIYDHIKPNGFGIFNIVGNPLLNDKYSKRIDNTIRSIFSSCMVVPLDYTDLGTNIIYMCQKNSSDQTIYIDNYNKVDFDIFHNESNL